MDELQFSPVLRCGANALKLSHIQVRTKDIGGDASTSQFITEVAKNLEVVEPAAVQA